MINEKSHPDSAGFWWYQSAHRPEWEMVKAREIYPGHICLYSCTKEWGGHTLELAREHLHGKWVKVNPPEQQQDNAQLLEAAFREGYVAGYDMGGSDVSAFECGSGSKHDNIRDRDQQDAWEQSDTYTAIHSASEDTK